MFKVIIAGGRDFNNYDLLKRKCDVLLKNKSDIEIVSGTANGADKLGERYAKENGYKIKRFPADWDKFQKRAGVIRNQQMAEYANACICFWDNSSKGTKWMIELANEKGLPTRVINY